VECANAVNQAFVQAGLRASADPVTPCRSVNLDTMASLTSGALALTLECSVSYDDPRLQNRLYSFEELMEPAFITLRLLLKEGLQRPFGYRATL